MSPAARGRFWSYVLLALALCCLLSGLGLIAGYFYWAVIERIGEPDQSLLFWYLPFLFTGVMAAMLGFGFGVMGAASFRTGRAPGAAAPGARLTETKE